MSFVPYAVSWNITSRCNLNCRHCYLDAGGRKWGGADEIPTGRALEIVSEIAEVNPGAVLILTGGEPLARRDIYEIIAKSAELGMMPVLGTNGSLLDTQTAGKLKQAGLAGVGVSVDSLKDEVHDTFRGQPGALKSAIAGLVSAREAGLAIQAQTTPTSATVDELPAIAKWAHELGAKVFNIFFLVCTGRGETMADITPDEYEQVLNWAASERDSFPGMMIRPKCAPHFKRILYQENPDNHLLKTYIAACRAGTHYCRIDPTGKVTPCPYMDIVAGDLTKQSFPDVWNGSESLKKYRAPQYGGKCGLCRYRLICGGCRARALATVGDEMGEDRWCVYEPANMEDAIENIDTMAKFGVDTMAPGAGTVNWSTQAEDRLNKIPVFARSIVKIAVEKYAMKNKINEITPEIMRTSAPAPPPMFARDDSRDNGQTTPGEKIPWDDTARARVENAPDFVRPGILKLMPKRARERGKKRIDSAFLTEIRNESMMLVTRRMKSFGFDDLDMGAWDSAKDKFKKDERRVELIDKIKNFLDERSGKNKAILEKFGSFFADNVGNKIGWTQEARERLDKAPAFARSMARNAVERYAKEHGYKYVTEEALDEAMAQSPFGRFAK